MKPFRASFLFAVAALAIPGKALAGAIDFTSALSFHDSQLSLGFGFTTNKAISVTALGYYDELGDGFLTDHEVGIFDTDGNLLVSTLLQAGSSAPLDGHYRYNAVTPISLPAGASFVISSTTFGFADGWVSGNKDTQVTDFVVDPAINVASDAARYLYQGDNVLRIPTNHFGGYTFYGGPNFQLELDETSTAPEPSSVALALGGLAGLLLAARQRHTRR
jgi:MYXO-CTERM domain-containing protein